MQTQVTATTTGNVVKLPLKQFHPSIKSMSELKEDIIKSLKEISSDPDMLAEFTKFMRNFHNYSLYNRILIFCQNREATQVAGYKTWKNLGRYVRKGERGIYILAPKLKVLEKDEDGEDSKTPKDKVLKGFMTVAVFDYSQTESIDGSDIEIPPFGKLIVHNPNEIYNRMKATAEESGIKVIESNMQFSTAGSTDGNIIRINRLTPLDARCSTITHELAHVYLGHLKDRKDLPRNQKEVEAELTSFLAGISIGLPKGNYEYIKNWLNGNDIENLTVETAIKTADRIVREVCDIC